MCMDINNNKIKKGMGLLCFTVLHHSGFACDVVDNRKCLLMLDFTVVLYSSQLYTRTCMSDCSSVCVQV